MRQRSQQPVEEPGSPHEVEIVRDVVYGHGLVHCDRPGGSVAKELKLDAYLPVSPPGADAAPRPALILGFGGAFHRGSKENDSFEAEGGNTPIAHYCLRFARRGYVACAIDYRLVPEDPDPGPTPVVMSPARIPTSRVDFVRRAMNLPPATSDMLWRGIEAASDDMAAATRFVRRQSAPWGLDPERIAIGGFSAGARTALNAAFGEKVPVAAVVSLSGFMDELDLRRHVEPGTRGPAVLIVHAENDLDYVVQATPSLVAHLRHAGLPCEHVHVPQAGHFYKAEAPAVHDSDGITTVEQAIATFLHRALNTAAQAPARKETR